jgi:plastocyanin
MRDLGEHMRIDRYGLVVLAALCAASCGDDDTVLVVFDAGPDAGQARHDAGGVGAENDGGAEEDGGVSTEPLTVRKIIVHAVEFKFTPKRISAKPGEHVTIELRNDGATTHAIQFNLPSGKKRLKPDVPASEKGRLKLTAPTKKGSYVFFCPIDDHRALGMVGTLVVR